jgi:peptide/nickel transport system substrate-binding protein
VREALAVALNREQIIGTVMQGQGRLANGFLPPESWAAAPSLPVRSFDLARAKQLLDEAGFPDPDGDGPQPRFALEFVTSNTGVAPQIAQIVQEQWRAAGVGVNLTQYERSTFTERINQGTFDAYFNISVGGNQTPDGLAWAYYGAVWGQDRADADAAFVAKDWTKMQAVLDRVKVCGSPELDRAVAAKDLSAVHDLLIARGAANRMRYCNPTVNDELLRAEASPDHTEQIALYGQAQRTIADELPHIYVWYSDNIIVSRKRVGNIQIDPAGAWFFLAKVTAS